MATVHEPGSRPGWLLDEVASAGRENLDDSHVARYDAKEDAGAVGEIALLSELGLTRESVVVDIGAGTGQLTIAAAPACGRVVAVDVSPVMLSSLRARVGAAQLTNVDVVQAGFLTYEHAGSPADFVYSRYALHHLPDFWKAVALTRLRRILRPGGVLRLWDVVYSFQPAAAEERIEAWCATGGADVEGGWSRAELEEHVRDEHSTFTLAPRVHDPAKRVRDRAGRVLGRRDLRQVRRPCGLTPRRHRTTKSSSDGSLVQLQ
jgi:ubiquinone/menaquinone biosynthesis C-methylase UbiE